MIKKLLVVHPQDPTTAFLNKIVTYFEKALPPEQLTIKIIEPNKKSHDDCIELLKEGDFDNMLFMGHGSSTSIQGASNDSYKHAQLLSANDLHILGGKNLIFLSCNSNDLFRKAKSKSYIGFGDMPTDWNEILAAREYEKDIYKGFTEETLEIYRSYLTKIIAKPLYDLTYSENYGLKACYLDIRLRINQLIATSYKDHNRNDVAYLMYNLRNDLTVRY